MNSQGRRPKISKASDRARAVTPLGAGVQAFLRASGLGPRIRDARIHQAWNEAVGSELARRARPARFRDGELLVEVDSAAHLGELTSFTGEQYRRHANRLLDAPSIERVVFKLKR